MRTGVFGGSFNPPHIGHLVVAEALRCELELDRVVWIPAAIAPHKNEDAVVDARHRYNMVDLAVSGNVAFSVSDQEIMRGGVSYTVDTLEDLVQRREYGDLFLMMGSDNFASFADWREPARIAELATLVVYPRHGQPEVPAPYFDAITVDCPRVEVSSTMVRRLIRDGVSARYLVPESVLQYISQHGLYLS